MLTGRIAGMEPVLATRLPRAWSATPSGGGMKGLGRKGDGEKDSYVTWQPVTEDAQKRVERVEVRVVRDPEGEGR